MYPQYLRIVLGNLFVPAVPRESPQEALLLALNLHCVMLSMVGALAKVPIDLPMVPIKIAAISLQIHRLRVCMLHQVAGPR